MKKLLAMALAFVMVLSLVPFTALAANPGEYSGDGSLVDPETETIYASENAKNIGV